MPPKQRKGYSAVLAAMTGPQRIVYERNMFIYDVQIALRKSKSRK